MCGILGTINKRFDTKVLDLLRHRGPDGAGITEFRSGPHRIQLGHRRLSIVDLSPAGRQPMLTPCGRCGLTFNGEIYNHQNLRKSGADVEYLGHSDTETILHYLASHGSHGVREFNGIFALGFVDLIRKTLFVARDRFGVKPLYYWASPDTFVFSSELRALRPLISDSIDLTNLAELLRLRYLPAPDTLFAGIRKVLPGHIIEVDLNGPRLKLREYPFIEESLCQEDVLRNQAEAVEQYGELVTQSVRRQLMSDVEIGVLLSGGVDSALLASIAQRHLPYRMKSFTVGFSGEHEADETKDARETARVVGLDHYEVRMGFPDFLESLRRVTTIVEEPLATASVIPMFHLSALAASHVKVVFSGQGADETMGGYRRYQTELWGRFVPPGAAAVMRNAARSLRIRSDTLTRGLAAMSQRDDVSRFLQIYSVFSAEQIKRLIGREETRAIERVSYFFDLLNCSKKNHSAERLMSLDLRMNLADDLLLYTDKLTMQHSLECRVPLLDRDLVQFAEHLPCKYRLRLRKSKIVHKEFARRTLPDSIVSRKKKGFWSPTDWLTKNNVLRDVLLDRSSRLASFFDLNEVKKVFQEQTDGFARERQLFLLTSIYYWLAETT